MHRIVDSFSDRLLHKGAVNKGKKTRVSLEFTLLVDKEMEK